MSDEASTTEELRRRLGADESVTRLAVNFGRETLSDGDAFEAEPGPNDCDAASD